MESIKIKTEFIKLGQLLKLANLVESGADAKDVIVNGEVKVNGNIEVQRGKKIYAGDIVSYQGDEIKVEN